MPIIAESPAGQLHSRVAGLGVKVGKELGSKPHVGRWLRVQTAEPQGPGLSRLCMLQAPGSRQHWAGTQSASVHTPAHIHRCLYGA